MPAEPPIHPPLFAERLSIPARWWPIALVGVAVAGAEVFGGFPWWVAVITYVALGVPVLALLMGMGRTAVVVDGAGLHAGGRTLAATDMAGATVLDAQQTRLRLPPGSAPPAHPGARGLLQNGR